MRVIGYKENLPITEKDSLIEFEQQIPNVSGKDLLIKVSAISVNPVDVKVRKYAEPKKGEYRVLGWDAVGEVVAIGEEATLFKPGDKVFYAGDLNRQGSNAEFQVVDERIVGKKPTTLTNSEAAALPLTSITAWELLFNGLKLTRLDKQSDSQSNDVILIIGASGGVGSILIQLAKKLTGATVVASASRKETKHWIKQLGADYVIDHSFPISEQLKVLNLGAITHVASLTHSESYIDSYVEVLKPFGKIALIDDPISLDITKMKHKSLSLHWEFMFTRSMFQTPDIIEQHNILTEVANLIDSGVVKTTLGQNLGCINVINLRKAHQLLESKKSIGKIVLEGFSK